MNNPMKALVGSVGLVSAPPVAVYFCMKEASANATEANATAASASTVSFGSIIADELAADVSEIKGSVLNIDRTLTKILPAILLDDLQEFEHMQKQLSQHEKKELEQKQ
jgi:hypothetical protein